MTYASEQTPAAAPEAMPAAAPEAPDAPDAPDASEAGAVRTLPARAVPPVAEPSPAGPVPPAVSAPPSLEDRAAGCLVGAAVGDALGGPVQGWSPEEIVKRHGGRVEGIVGPFHDNWRTARPLTPYHKGDGHVTDDTLMTHALVRVYETVRDHLDAYDIADHLVPDLIGTPRWIPELETEALPLQRIFLAEKWIVARLHYGHADPREAGVGNIVNCGAAMYMAPVGIVNAGNPDRAYAEALDIAGAHQASYGREAAGVFAAAVAAAFLPDATPSRSSSRRCGWPRTAPGPRSRRSARPRRRSPTPRRRRHRCGRPSPPSTRWARTTATRRSAPGAPPGCTPSRNFPSPWACC